MKALKENEQGRTVGDLSRELHIDKSTFYYWRKKYGDMEQQQLKRLKQSLGTPSVLNICWSIGFMSDALTDDRKIRVFNAIDDCNREAIAIDAALSYPVRAVVETLDYLKEEIGTPKYVRCNNDPEFVSKAFMNWYEKNFIEIKYIQPVKPMQNEYMERIYRFFREDILDAYYFNDHLSASKNK